MSAALLSVHELEAGYGKTRVLRGGSFSVGTEIVGVVGRNGVGKTTLTRTLVGSLPALGGDGTLLPFTICFPRSVRVAPAARNSVHELRDTQGVAASARRRRQCEGDLPARTGTDRQCCSHGRVTAGIRVRPRDRHDGTTMDRSTKSDERSS